MKIKVMVIIKAHDSKLLEEIRFLHMSCLH